MLLHAADFCYKPGTDWCGETDPEMPVFPVNIPIKGGGELPLLETNDGRRCFKAGDSRIIGPC